MCLRLIKNSAFFSQIHHQRHGVKLFINNDMPNSVMKKHKLIIYLTVIPFLLFSQRNKLFDYCTVGLTYGLGNTFYENTALNTYLIEKGYFPVYDNNNFESPPNTMNIGVEIYSKKSSQYCRLSMLKSLNISDKEVNNKSFVNYTGLSLDLFNDFCKNDKWVLAPMVGVSVFDFYMSAVSSGSISNLTQTNLEEGFYKKGVFCLKPGVEIKRKFQIGSCFVGVGINGYYQFELGNGKWGNLSGEQ